MRTIVDIPPNDIKRLDRLAKAQQVSRAEIVRRAVVDYAQRQQQTVDVFGLWRNKPVDGLTHQQKLRAEWDR